MLHVNYGFQDAQSANDALIAVLNGLGTDWVEECGVAIHRDSEGNPLKGYRAWVTLTSSISKMDEAGKLFQEWGGQE